MPLHTPQRRNNELTSMNVNIKFLPSSVTKRLFFFVLMTRIEKARGPTLRPGKPRFWHGRSGLSSLFADCSGIGLTPLFVGHNSSLTTRETKGSLSHAASIDSNPAQFGREEATRRIEQQAAKAR